MFASDMNSSEQLDSIASTLNDGLNVGLNDGLNVGLNEGLNEVTRDENINDGTRNEDGSVLF